MRYIECDWCGQRASVSSTHVPATLALAVTGLVRGPDDTVALDVCGADCASQAVRAMRRGMSAERAKRDAPPAARDAPPEPEPESTTVVVGEPIVEE